MSTFPLYDSLKDKIPKVIVDIPYKDKDFFTEQVSNLDTTEHELIYALIRYYQIQNEPQDTIPSIFPYGAKKLKKGMKIDFEKLPTKLQYMLICFIRLHLTILKDR